MELEAFLEEARKFAAGEYLSALYQGTRLAAEERESIAEKMAGMIGLEKEYILKKNLRVSMEDFCSQLLGDQRLLIGRQDSRYTGPAVDGDLGDGTSDPSNLGIIEAFSAVMNNYVTQDLGYMTDRPYEVLSLDVNEKWDYGEDNAVVAQEDEIRDCMSANRFLKVWVICGYYDLATPFFGTEWVFSHLFLNGELEKNLAFKYYPAGHMFYLLDANVSAFRGDAEAWFGK
jgi:carboxypeptidase C (cathepsin A)